MLRKSYLILFISFVVMGCKSNDSLKADEELRTVIKKIWADAVACDLEELRAIHLDSPKFSKFGPRIAERQDVKSTNETETEHFLSMRDASFELEDIKVDIFGDIAVTTFYNNYSFIKNKIRVQGKGRVTLVFLNTEAGWKIVHEHSSPFNPQI